MQEKACLASIRKQYSSLTRTERQIADYILSNDEAVAEMSVAELASASHTAGSAVIRFCKTMGYTGFSQFRLALARELAVCAIPLQFSLEAGDTNEKVMKKVFGAAVRTLKNTMSMLDFSKIEMLAGCFSQAERICIFGVGTSSPVVDDAQYRFLELGYSASGYTDILFMPVAAMNMKKGEIAIGISHSGRTKETLKAVKLAKEQEATVVAITSYRASPLAKMADYAMITYADDITYPVEAVSARLAHLCVIDALTVSLALRGGNEAAGRLSLKNQVLEEIRKETEE